MLSVLVMAIGLVLYGLVYYGYVKWFDKNVIQSDPKRTTPAHTYMDGVEFFPTNRYVLFGFQWKSIAGISPIVGPILAIQWGWLPALLWILFGNTVIGWIHDYGSIMTSVRSEGASFGPITYELISPRARTILISYILFYLVLILSSFGNTVASTFATYPMSPIPILVLTLVGVLSGYMVYKFKINIVYTTVFALVVMVLGIWLGMLFPISVPKEIAFDFWLVATLLFCFVGAVLPIWVFIQPINYMSFYLVYTAIVGIIAGIFAGFPDFNRVAFTTFFDPKVTATGPLWPMMFVTIACGAISGWHGLVGSSCSSKQLDAEPDARFIGAGSMLAEGVMALVALVAVAMMTPQAVTGLAPASIFVKGGSTLLGYVGLPAAVGSAYLSVMIIVLAITIMHLALRISRLALAELAGPSLGGLFRNMYITAIIVSAVVYLVTSPSTGAAFAYIWGTFGGANQLMAGMALMIATLWLTKSKRPTIYTAVPMLFMLVTTISALLYLVYTGVSTYVADLTKIGAGIAAFINIALLILAFFMCYEGAKAFQKIRAAAK